MKIICKKSSFLFAMLTIAFFQLTAQIIINKTDMPSVNDIVCTSTGLNLDFIDYQETGENYVWDFSQLIPIIQTVDTFVSLSDVSPVYDFFFFGASNLVNAKSNRIPIPDFPISDSYTFFNSKDNYFGIAGEGFILYGLPIPLKFDSHDVLYRFPMAYGNTGNSYAQYALGLDNYGYLKKEVTRSNTVDGWGTITTPYGTFDVLRMKSEVIAFDSIYIDSLGIGLPLYREYTEYSWMGKGHKVPLLKITSSLGGVVVTYVDSVRFNPSAINEAPYIDDNKMRIFPVPSKDIINISFELLAKCNIEIAIYNINGVKVAERRLLNQIPGVVNIEMNLRQCGLKNGLYLLKIISGNQQINKKVVLY